MPLELFQKWMTVIIAKEHMRQDVVTCLFLCVLLCYILKWVSWPMSVCLHGHLGKNWRTDLGPFGSSVWLEISLLLGLEFPMFNGIELIGRLLLTVRVREKAVLSATNELFAHLLVSSSECKQIAASQYIDQHSGCKPGPRLRRSERPRETPS